MNFGLVVDEWTDPGIAFILLLTMLKSNYFPSFSMMHVMIMQIKTYSCSWCKGLNKIGNWPGCRYAIL